MASKITNYSNIIGNIDFMAHLITGASKSEKCIARVTCNDCPIHEICLKSEYEDPEKVKEWLNSSVSKS